MNPTFVLLYVESAPRSVALYEKVLGRPALETSANFAMFALNEGVMLGLWARHDVSPSSAAAAGASELALTVERSERVDETHAQWLEHGVTIAQAPVTLDFGRTFLALDPDGHRLRVFAPPPN